jgi:hypothetical protein
MDLSELRLDLKNYNAQREVFRLEKYLNQNHTKTERIFPDSFGCFARRAKIHAPSGLGSSWASNRGFPRQYFYGNEYRTFSRNKSNFNLAPVAAAICYDGVGLLVYK